jgi:hypothetical protein
VTKEELQKRLKFIAATPIKESVGARDNLRRGTGKVEVTTDASVSEFDSFFDFEEDIADLESARQQVERVEAARLKKENNQKILELNSKSEEEESSEDQSFLMLEEDDVQEETTTSGFLVFEEESAEEVVESKESESKEDETIVTVERADGSNYTKVKGFDFKYCKYIKSNDEQCKRQAPKAGDYCGTHRKLLGKKA